jgi:hypothetical protein
MTDALDKWESLHRLIHEQQTDMFSNTLLQREVFKNIASLLEVHDWCSKLAEELALQGFGEEVANHFFRGTTFDAESQFALMRSVMKQSRQLRCLVLLLFDL